MQHFALDLLTLCTNHGAVIARFTHIRAMSPKFANYRADIAHTGIFYPYYKAILPRNIKVILHFAIFEMQRFAKLCITMHNYVQDCTDSTQDMNRAQCLGSDSPCHL